MNLLQGKVIVITGGSSGLGAIVANLAAKHGGQPVMIGRSIQKLKQVAADISLNYGATVPYYVLDVSDLNQVLQTFQAIYQQHHFIDILVNNAGYGIFQPILETEEHEFEHMMKVNYLGTVYCTKQVLPSMIKERKGHIINVASQAGKVGTQKSAAYSATKHAQLVFTTILRQEQRQHGIQVTAVNPGPIRTPFFDKADQDGTYTKNMDKFMLDPHFVAQKIISAMIRPVREINLPLWMDMGSRLFQLMPQTMERLTGRILNKK